MTQSESDQSRSIYRFRWLGYGLLLLAVFDLIEVIFPPLLGNPEWELQAIGNLVERIPVALLGLVLIFYGEDYDRTGLEEKFLRLISWGSLLACVLFVAVIPLALNDARKIDSNNSVQINAQLNQQLAELQQVEDQVNKGTPDDIQRLVVQLQSQGIQVEGQNAPELKTQLLSRLANNREKLKKDAADNQNNLRLGLLKSSVKWALGSLVSSLLFFRMWWSTRWSGRM